MKRGTPEHPKLHELASRLALEKWGAVGVVEALFHFAAAYARRGDIGRHSDLAIARALGWSRDAGELVGALVDAGWLDRCECHRLRVHDWPDHADQTVARTHEVKQRGFLECYGARGAAPAPYRLPPMDAPAPKTSAPLVSTERETTLPLPTPTPEPEPTPTDNAPPGPPADAGGIGGGGGFRPGDTLPDGTEALDVDADGRPLVVARFRSPPGAGEQPEAREMLSPPRLTRHSAAAVERLVVIGSAPRFGYTFPRAARRRLRERLLSGESEAAIVAGWERTLEALAVEPEDPPGWTGYDQEPGHDVDQAVRLSGGGS